MQPHTRREEKYLRARWWHTPTIPALTRRQKDSKFIVRSCLTKTKARRKVRYSVESEVFLMNFCASSHKSIGLQCTADGPCTQTWLWTPYTDHLRNTRSLLCNCYANVGTFCHVRSDSFEVPESHHVHNDRCMFSKFSFSPEMWIFVIVTTISHFLWSDRLTSFFSWKMSHYTQVFSNKNSILRTEQLVEFTTYTTVRLSFLGTHYASAFGRNTFCLFSISVQRILKWCRGSEIF